MENRPIPRKNKRRKILDLLAARPLTVEDIELELKKEDGMHGTKRDLIWVYISQFKREGLIEELNEKRNNFKVYRAMKKKENQDLDTEILKKLIIPFAKAGIKVKLGDNEQERIKELFKEVSSNG